MDPGDMVNTGPYLALVDMNKCQNNNGGSSAAAAGATNFANAVVDVTRASNTAPMIGKVWLSLTEQGSTTNVYAYLSATQSPASAPPYGAFRMDYIGQKDGNAGFNGYIDSTTPGVINFLETGQQSSNTALAMATSSTTSGSGTMFVGGNGGGSSPVTFNFAYNPGYFRRSDGTNDQCFDRSSANANTAVWQYGTYNANDGTRVDQANPGFPVLATYQGNSYYGFANYWGINFQGLTIPDGSPAAGLTVTDQRPGNTTSYALNKLGGKLTKWTQVSTTLGALDGIPFTYGADLTGLTSGNPAVTGMNNWVMQWNSAEGNFTVVGLQTCDNNGCVTATVDARYGEFERVQYRPGLRLGELLRRQHQHPFDGLAACGGRRGVLLHPIDGGSRERRADVELLESVPDGCADRRVRQRESDHPLCQWHGLTMVQCAKQREYSDLHLWCWRTLGPHQRARGLGEPSRPVSICAKRPADRMAGRSGPDECELPGWRFRCTGGESLPARESCDVLHLADGTEPMEPVAVADDGRKRRPL